MPKYPKVPDEHIIRLNGLGLSLERVGELLGYHASTVKHRLEAVGIPAFDTRRSFGEKLYERLTPLQREWLSNQLYLGQPLDAYITSLITNEYFRSINSKKKVSDPNG